MTKDDLYKEIWQGRFVSESALSTRIKAARQAVGDTGEDQRIIRTLHGRGFRFVAEGVVEAGDSARQEPANGSAKGSASVAVLLFINMSGDLEQEYFSDGITEDLTTDLSRISGLFVPARNSTFRYKGAAVDVQQLCKDLGVRHVLEGSVRKSGSRVRITAQLVDGETGGHLWAERYDRDFTDVFAVQDEITHRIVESLRVTLLPSERAAIEKVPTDNLEAYQYYLRGRQFFHLQTKSSLDIAKRMFERAIKLDPNYARAYAGLADCESERYMGSYADVAPQSILAASARALELDPDLAEAHASRGLALSTLSRHDEAEQEFKAAMRLDPNLFEVLKFYERELQQHPESANAAALGACVLATLGETARAKDWASMALSLDPDDLLTQYNTACAYALMGEAGAAIDLLERAIPRIRGRLQTRIRHDSDFNALRAHPRFQALLETVAG